MTWKFNSIFTLLMGCTLVCMMGCGRSLPGQVATRKTEVLNIRKALGEGVETSSSTDAADVLEPTGYVTLRGSFKISGTPPVNPKLLVDRDQEFCEPNGMEVFAEEVVVDPASGGIKNVVIFADSLEDSWIHESAQGNTEDVLFDQKACVFLTHVMGMQSTQTLMIKNSDPGGHNASIKPKTNNEDNILVPSGLTLPYKPSTAERDPFPLTCSIHSWMKAYVLIRDDSYFSISEKDGTFEIPNLPAGVPIELRIWHELINGGVQNVTFKGQPTNWRKGRMTITLDPDETQNNFEVVIASSEFE
ncbi:MAG: hypothetical protein ACKVH8_04115 [Pirellulales bacterium]